MEHEPTARGLATTHFAGVGGLIQTEQGLLPTGIFNKNSAIRIEDVTDGMSQTLVAGEIARALPAWAIRKTGEPSKAHSINDCRASVTPREPAPTFFKETAASDSSRTKRRLKFSSNWQLAMLATNQPKLDRVSKLVRHVDAATLSEPSRASRRSRTSEMNSHQVARPLPRGSGRRNSI